MTQDNYANPNQKFKTGDDLEDMIDDFITFFIAGQETTANALAFCFYELARNALKTYLNQNCWLQYIRKILTHSF